jgi:DNA-binding cell septation regulator SpoVG
MEAKKKEIFLAMPFRKETEDSYQAIKEVINDINIEENLEIKIKEIRLDNLEK